MAIATVLASAAACAETTTGEAIKATLKPSSSNWQGSLILEGVYFDRSKTGEMDINGMPPGAEIHRLDEGLRAGHNEIVVNGNLTDKLTARVTTAIAQAEKAEGGGVETELEEAFVQTQGIGNGFNAKAGRFFTDVGYLSSKHGHEWDFVDQPLIYESMFGTHPNGDGLQVSYVAPTDMFLQVGSEVFAGDKFPSGKTRKGVSAATAYAKIGGDIGTSHSWQAGVGRWQAGDITDRSPEMEEDVTEAPHFSGNSHINTVNALYKWAPNGNPEEHNLKLQAEYFQRDEKGTVAMEDADGAVSGSTDYKGKQNGWYAQAVYQFQPHWRVGARHDHLHISNSGSDAGVLDAAGLTPDPGHDPKRNSLMLDYSPREYSRWRLQVNRDERGPEADNQVLGQFIYSFGSHGAHGF